MTEGTVVVINGTTSSGKTSAADALQNIMDEPFLRFSSDFFKIPAKFDRKPHVGPLLARLLHGHYHCMRELALTGNNLIADVVIEDPGLLEECVKNLCDLNAYLIGVHCPLDELEQRERGRGDRSTGMAKGQLRLVHAHGLYDFEIDTSVSDPSRCAEQIRQFIRAHQPCALKKLRVKNDIDPGDPSFGVNW